MAPIKVVYCVAVIYLMLCVVNIDCETVASTVSAGGPCCKEHPRFGHHGSSLQLADANTSRVLVGDTMP
ncbi:hypothetical protein Q3G72_027810 [Acer saccharum]|nr:hypothetical protein Q3G72_027810 [Acer saccharum]